MTQNPTNASANSGTSGSSTVPGQPNINLQPPGNNVSNNISLNPAATNVPLAPYLFISVTSKAGKGSELHRFQLEDYLRRVVGGGTLAPQTVTNWAPFAKVNHLMAGSYPLTTPDIWFLGNKRWITITWQSDWEVHIHFGFVNQPGQKHTHIQLASDTKNWLSELAGAAKSNWWNITNPTVVGEANIVGYETGIKVRPRHSFISTLKSKESAMTAAAVCVPCISFLIKNYQPAASFKPMVPNFIIAIVCLVGSTLLTSTIRHFFALPPFSWGVAELED